MVLDPTAGQCEERAGFLFPHDCDREAVARCDECRKAICLDHRHGADSRDLCTTCAGKYPDAASRFHQSPFFLGRRYYARPFNLDFDPDDFTDADGPSTLTEGTDAFENDLEAS